jgi:hypothetical protein
MRATYYEAEFRSLQQGDLSITEYTMRLKQLADSLRDVGYPVSEPSQVLNLLRGLNPRFRHVKPVINSKTPPHTFMSARSYLLLEEIQMQHDAKMEAGTALYASNFTDDGASNSRPTDDGSGGFGNSNQRSKDKSKKCGKGSAGGGALHLVALRALPPAACRHDQALPGLPPTTRGRVLCRLGACPSAPLHPVSWAPIHFFRPSRP